MVWDLFDEDSGHAEQGVDPVAHSVREQVPAGLAIDMASHLGR